MTSGKQYSTEVLAYANAEADAAGDPHNKFAWYFRAMSQLKRFVEEVDAKDFDSAKRDWMSVVSSAKRLDIEMLLPNLLGVLFYVGGRGEILFAGELIEETNSGEPFFLLASAFNYFLKGDDSLIEKLSPEVRGSVEEIVANLRKATAKIEQPKIKSRKPKSGTRRRTRKQLR